MDAVRFSRITAPEMLATPPSGEGAGRPGGAAGEGSFASLVSDGLERLDQLEAEADVQVKKLLAGEDVELHRVILAGEEAALAFELMTAVRNKVVDAYQEVMRMQV